MAVKAEKIVSQMKQILEAAEMPLKRRMLKNTTDETRKQRKSLQQNWNKNSAKNHKEAADNSRPHIDESELGKYVIYRTDQRTGVGSRPHN